ncbi:MAG: glycosyltransferase [Alphaproteobacteria bacterium]
MRVMQVLGSAAQGGAEAFFERLVLALHHAGVKQHVLIRPFPEREAILRAEGLEPALAPFGGIFDFQTPGIFRREIAKFRPDIVFTWLSRASAAAPKGKFAHVARMGGYYDLKYYRSADHLIGNTEDIRDYLVAKGWPAERAHYVPNFVDGSEAEPEPRAQHHTPEDVPLVLALGRLHENKAFDVLLRAFRAVPRAHLWIAGTGPEHDKLLALAEAQGIKDRVHFLGWRRDVAKLFAACDVFVCPSRHEPLGNVVLEAFAHRRPVVAARSQGPSMLIEDGKSGLLVPVDDPSALAAALTRMIDDADLRARCTVAAREIWRTKYSEDVVVRRYLELFQSFLAPAKTRAPSFAG